MIHSSLRYALVSMAFLLAGAAYAQPVAGPDLARAPDIALYIAPNGSDTQSGGSRNEAVQTLDRIQQLLRAHQFKDSEHKVAVRFLPGTYHGLQVIWDFYSPGRTIVFEPDGYRPGSQSVVVDGANTNAAQFFLLRLQNEAPDDAPITTGIVLRGFRITNYCEGISLGDWKAKANVAGNLIEDNVFYRIGSKYETPSRQADGRVIPKGNCVAAIRLQRASNNVVRKNVFTNIENLPQKQTGIAKYGPRLLHAIYVSNNSVGNLIEGNRFSRFTGTPVQIRAQSDDTRVLGNTFTEPVYPGSQPDPSQRIHAVAQWYCNDAVPACLQKAKAKGGNNECVTLGIQVVGNRIGSDLDVYNDESQSPNATCTQTRPPMTKALEPKVERNSVIP